MANTLLQPRFRRLLLGVEILLFLLAAGWLIKFAWAAILERNATPEKVSRALRFDPTNSRLWNLSGSYYQYSLEAADHDKALAHFKRAIALSPYDPINWLELGSALRFRGSVQEARAALRQATLLAPRAPQVAWIVGNAYLLSGEVNEALDQFRVVLSGADQYNQILYDTAWKASGDPKTILSRMIPNDVDKQFNYLAYLVARERYPAALGLWNRIIRSGEHFRPGQASGYMDKLFEAHRPAEAYQV